MEYGGRSNAEHNLVWVGIIGIFGLLVLFVAYTFWPNGGATSVSIGPKTFYADVADTDETREIGLTQHATLKENQALLMIYDHDAVRPMMTKGMQFPVDIVWLDSNKRVAFVARNAKPSETNVFRPSGKTRYVMMFPAGSAAKYNISVGQSVDFSYTGDM